MIVRFHKYLWYRLYKFNLESWNDSLIALSQTTAGLCALIFGYLFTIAIWLSRLTGSSLLLRYSMFPKWALLILPAAIVITVLAFWIPGGRYKKIIDEFDALQESAAVKIRRAIYLWLYVFLWIFLFFSGIFL